MSKTVFRHVGCSDRESTLTQVEFSSGNINMVFKVVSLLGIRNMKSINWEDIYRPASLPTFLPAECEEILLVEILL